MTVKDGDIIQSPRWPEPMEVDLVEMMGGYVRIVGVTLYSRDHIDDLIPENEFSTLIPQKLELNCTAQASHVFLGLEAIRYRFAALYDPLLAMNTSKVDALPHQIDAVYGKILKLPRIRFLIADDPGAGKTIMAGLILKELKLRHLVSRILLVVPGHLKDQWSREMDERFEEHFASIDRGILDAFYGENAWQREAQIITSIDFAKREDVLPSLSSSSFDLIIVDEAHKMSAYRYGDKITKTERYKLGEVLSRIGNHLVFLTATPHRGDPENYRLFLDLLQPGVFATSEMLRESISLDDNDMIIRRVKETLKNFKGEPLFLPRYVTTVPFNLGISSPKEKRLYNDVSKYVNTQYNKALAGEKRRNIAFALVILQRRLASSTYALLKSVERRQTRLAELLDGPPQKLKTNEKIFDLDTIEDLSEAETWKIEGIWETLSVAENREELAREIETLDELARKAKEIIEEEEEIKIRELKDTLQRLNQRFLGHKVLIFTESRDTLDYLERRIKSWGYSVNTIHGGMKLQDRIRAESIFKNETQVLLATEAAGEGINLQFCHIMINYDIPWNPNRLEQRMGRIHRYGQIREVFVFNLVAVDTREGKVLNRIFEKLEEIKNALGSDKVFDVISDAIQGKNLAQLMLEAAANARNIDDILEDIDIKIDAKYIANVKKSLDESLATSFINYPLINEMKSRSLEHRLIPKYTTAFFEKGFAEAGGKSHTRKDNFLSIDSIPFELRQIAQDDTFEKRYGSLSKAYQKATFDKEVAFKHPDAEFISFGHPLFEGLLEWVHRIMSSSLKRGAVFNDHDGKMDGNVLFYEGEIRDGEGKITGKRLFAFYVDRRSGDVMAKNPAFIWDVSEATAKRAGSIDVEGLKGAVLQCLLPTLEEYKIELSEERMRQSQIKEKYGVRSLEYLIDKIDGDLIELYDRRDRQENVDLVIYNKEEQKKKYESALTELLQALEREKILTIGTPIFVGAICIVPSKTVPPERMKSDAEIEMIGMKKAMAHERDQGRVPEDVSLENLGFDIRSTDKNGDQRYIEVKARAGIGKVVLTQNEMFRAEDFGDKYFLYVVMNASERPELRAFRDPAHTLVIEEEIERRFTISSDELQLALRDL